MARTIAYPIRWVKEIFPPRLRLRKLLITIRLSAINFAGTARTEVAVGTSSEDVIFFTTAAATPRNGVVVTPVPSASCAAFAAFAAFAATMSPGFAVVAGLAGRAAGGDVSVDSLPPTRGCAAGWDTEAIVGERVAAAGPFAAAGAVGAGAVGAGAATRARVGGGGGGGLDGRVELVMAGAVFACGAGAAFAGDAVAGGAVVIDAGAVAGVAVTAVALRGAVVTAAEAPPLPTGSPLRVLFPDPLSAKKSRQMRSTLSGSARNC